MRTSKKRRQHLRSAFVTTVASAAVTVIASGCQSKVSVSCFGEECGQGGASSSQSTGPGPPAVCPEIVPVHGASCPEVALVCAYEDEGPCPSTYNATCAPDGRWEVESTFVSCNPPPCPVERPVAGTDCVAPWEDVCEYDGLCPAPDQFRCVDGTWVFDSPLCNPPPPSACLQQAQEQCATLPGCEWLYPGCGDLISLPEPSCHPAGYPCDQNPWLCPADMKCQAVSIDPCVDKPCDACHETAWLCLPAQTDPDEG